MKRLILVVVFQLFIVSRGGLAGVFPIEGAYTGSGRWFTVDGRAGNFKTEIKFGKKVGEDIEVGEKYVFDSFHPPVASTWIARTVGPQIFNYVSNNKQMGTGWCDAQECQIRLIGGGQEKLTFFGPHLLRNGTKFYGKNKVLWEMNLLPRTE